MFDRIQKEIPKGLLLYTPVLRSKFEVKSIEPERLVFLAGKTNIEVSRTCWNGITDFLEGKDWVRIGALHDTLEKIPEGTLERYLRENSSKDKSKESQASYVASLLEHLGIAEVHHGRPSQIRLKAQNNH